MVLLNELAEIRKSLEETIDVPCEEWDFLAANEVRAKLGYEIIEATIANSGGKSHFLNRDLASKQYIDISLDKVEGYNSKIRVTPIEDNKIYLLILEDKSETVGN